MKNQKVCKHNYLLLNLKRIFEIKIKDTNIELGFIIYDSHYFHDPTWSSLNKWSDLRSASNFNITHKLELIDSKLRIIHKLIEEIIDDSSYCFEINIKIK